MKINKNKYLSIVAPLVFVLLSFISANAQKKTLTTDKPKPPVKRNIKPTGSLVPGGNFTLKSKLMARDLPYRVFLPKDYDSGKRFPVIYLLHGLTGHYDNWSDKTKLAQYLEPYHFIVVMPEGNNGWYTDSATVPNDKYESYIIQELIPEVDKNFRTVANRENRIIAGLSMGGYGSLKFGLKHPEMFALVGSFSGALGAADWTNAQFQKMGLTGAIPESINSVYGADYSQTRRDNDIFAMVKNITSEKTKTLPYIYQSCGTEDFLIQNNHDFLALLNEKKIPHEFRETPGIHNWVFWDAQVQEFLKLADRMLNAKAKAA